MSLSLKAELEIWASALQSYDQEDFDSALKLFSQIADSSKILTNMGLIYATVGEHEMAVQQFNAATSLDQYLAIAYFQCGVSNFLLGRYDLCLSDFEEALLYLRGNQAINYEQIGLKFRLFSAEVLFNKGLSRINLGYLEEGLDDMEEARKEKVTEEHDVIDEAIRDHGEGYTVFSIPVGVLYRPSENKLKNSKTKDYMGKAKLVAASDANDAFTTFSGVTRLKQGITPQGSFVENLPDDSAPELTRSVTLPPPNVDPIDPPTMPAPAIARSKTTLDVPSDARQRTARVPPSRRPPSIANPIKETTNTGIPRSKTSAATSSIARSNTGSPRVIKAVPSPSTISSTSSSGPTGLTPPSLMVNAVASAPSTTKVPTVRKRAPRRPRLAQAGTTPALLLPDDPPQQPQSVPTDVYDGYTSTNDEDESQSLAVSPLPTPSATPMKELANVEDVDVNPNANANQNYPKSPNQAAGRVPARAPSRNAFGGSVRRKVTRRPTQMRRPVVTYEEEEEEGYVSGEYDDFQFEMTKIKVKLHYQGDVRGMTFAPDISYEEFVDRVTNKFGVTLEGLGIQFKDEDGGKISLRDDSDFELAIETARESAKGKPEGKLEIWCTDI